MACVLRHLPNRPGIGLLNMSPTLQTIIALALVAIAAGWLIHSAFSKKSSSGCGGGGCSAVSPEVKKLRARLKH